MPLGWKPGSLQSCRRHMRYATASGIATAKHESFCEAALCVRSKSCHTTKVTGTMTSVGSFKMQQGWKLWSLQCHCRHMGHATASSHATAKQQVFVERLCVWAQSHAKQHCLDAVQLRAVFDNDRSFSKLSPEALLQPITEQTNRQCGLKKWQLK